MLYSAVSRIQGIYFKKKKQEKNRKKFFRREKIQPKRQKYFSLSQILQLNLNKKKKQILTYSKKSFVKPRMPSGGLLSCHNVTNTGRQQ